jgi:hypothetical protein
MMKAVPVVSVITQSGTKRKRERNGGRLHDGQQHRDIASPLGDLTAAKLAFLLQFRQRLIDDRQQLEDDRRRDVRHDAEGEDRQLAQVTAGEHVHQAHRRARVLVEELRQHVGIDAWRRNVRAQAIDGQQAKREQHALAKVGDAKDIGDFLKHRRRGPRV